jgi:hypothetical protein
LFIDNPIVIQVKGRQAVTYSPIGYYCEVCGSEIYLGIEEVANTSKPKPKEGPPMPYRHVICGCRWQRVHVRGLPKTAKEWISFWQPWSPDPSG